MNSAITWHVQPFKELPYQGGCLSCGSALQGTTSLGARELA